MDDTHWTATCDCVKRLERAEAHPSQSLSWWDATRRGDRSLCQADVLPDWAQADVDSAERLLGTGAVWRKNSDDGTCARGALQAKVHPGRAAAAAARPDVFSARVIST